MKKNFKLDIELVPRTCWYSNVRSCVSTKDWNTLRKESYALADNKCEICNGVGRKHPVECHEVWEYDDKNKVQKLIRLISLCPSCHKVKHPGLAQQKGQLELVIKQFSKVNDCSRKTALKEIAKSFDLWRERSSFEWKIDMSFLDDKNISYHSDR